MRFPSILALAFAAVASPSAFVPSAGAMAKPPAAVACGPDSYINSSGHCVHRPVPAPRAPAGASARCR